MSTFSGNIVCHVINKNAVLPFDDLKGLLKDTSYNFESVKNWAVEQYFQVIFIFSLKNKKNIFIFKSLFFLQPSIKVGFSSFYFVEEK